MGRPDDPATWDSLDMMVFDRVLRFKDGLGLKVSTSFVDEGPPPQKCVRVLGVAPVFPELPKAGVVLRG